MSDLISTPVEAMPLPPVPVSIREGTDADIPFMDGLQKRHSKQVGFMPRGQLQEKIRLGHVLVAEDRHEGTEARRHEEGSTSFEETGSASHRDAPPTESDARSLSVPTCLRASVPLGYVISTDRYFKRDDVGIIYQMNIVPEKQRSLVAATLLKAVFERSAYGCRLYCCWCAQDIAANRFWEAMGFIPLAYRAGSREKGRVHIFWQRRIREGDTTTPYWFPSQTSSGSIREDRLVLPIPPGTHWGEAKPVLLEQESGDRNQESGGGSLKQIGNPKSATRNPKQIGNQKSKIQNASRAIAMGGLRFGAAPVLVPEPAVKTPREPRKKVKADPTLVAMTRELRDRYLEQYNAGDFSAPVSKYAIGRRSNGADRGERVSLPTRPARMLPAA